jgi:hypothetical protein
VLSDRFIHSVSGGPFGMASNRDKTSEQVIILGLLDAVERGDVTQRSLSRELGIAVGLVNTYVKRCINKGLIKFSKFHRAVTAIILLQRDFWKSRNSSPAILSIHSIFFAVPAPHARRR